MAAVLPVFSPVCTLLGAWKPLALSCVTVKPAVLVGGAHMQRTGDQAVSGLHSSAGGGGGGGVVWEAATPHPHLSFVSCPVEGRLRHRGDAHAGRFACVTSLLYRPQINSTWVP